MDQVQRSPQVDSLRGVATVIVASVHTMVLSGLIFHPGWARPILDHADVVVTIFFCISGYVLYRPFVRAHLGGTGPSIGDYTIRRLMRIGPAYWVALTISAVLLGWHYVFTPTGLVNYYGFLYLYGDHPLSAIEPGWTLCVEITFYLFLPIWAWLLRRAPARERESIFRLHLFALVGLGLLSALYVVAVLQFAGLGNVNPARTWQVAWLPSRLSEFAIGMTMAVLAIRAQEGIGLPRIVGLFRDLPWLAVLTAAGLFGVTMILVKQDYSQLPAIYRPSDYVLRMVLFWGIGAAILIPAVFPREGSWVDRLLTSRVLASLGLMSYGIYLWHWPLLVFFSNHTPLPDYPSTFGYVEWFIAAIPATLVLGALSYVIVERPAINWAHRVTKRDRREGETAAAPPLGAAREG